VVKNAGHTPAYQLRIYILFRLVTPNERSLEEPQSVWTTRVLLGAGDEFKPAADDTENQGQVVAGFRYPGELKETEDGERLARSEAILRTWGKIKYMDIFQKEERYVDFAYQRTGRLPMQDDSWDMFPCHEGSGTSESDNRNNE
jgi:hypothetical protein